MAGVLEEKTRHLTCHRPLESSDRAVSGSVRAGFSVWPGARVTWTPPLTYVHLVHVSD